jgi:dGTPase
VRDENDYFRTRLTHSLEVAQIARSIARVLALDEDLAETLALAHDLGHTPFGHAGEEALSDAARAVGGFDHNAHTLRLVTSLEHRYAKFDGLNLTWETLEGLAKHNGPVKTPVPGLLAAMDAVWPLDLAAWPGLEAQVSSLADDIAYLSHDIDDGLRARLFQPDDLKGVELAGEVATQLIGSEGEELELGRFIGQLASALIGSLIEDLVGETRSRVSRSKVLSVDGVHAQPGPLVAFSPRVEAQMPGLRGFLFAHVYRHPRVMGAVEKAKTVVRSLYERFCTEPSLLPGDWSRACAGANDAATLAVVRDYIAGMTDRYALSEYRRLFSEEIVL